MLRCALGPTSRPCGDGLHCTTASGTGGRKAITTRSRDMAGSTLKKPIRGRRMGVGAHLGLASTADGLDLGQNAVQSELRNFQTPPSRGEPNHEDTQPNQDGGDPHHRSDDNRHPRDQTSKGKFLYSGSHSALRRPHSIQCIALERINTQNSEYTQNILKSPC